MFGLGGAVSNFAVVVSDIAGGAVSGGDLAGLVAFDEYNFVCKVAVKHFGVSGIFYFVAVDVSCHVLSVSVV